MSTEPVYEMTETDPRRDFYIARCAPWTWHDADHIDIVDPSGQVVVTLNKWQTWIFHEADGGRTVRNLLAWISYHYREPQTPPPDLETTVLRALSELVEDLRVVELFEKGPVLPDHLLTPWTGPVPSQPA